MSIGKNIKQLRKTKKMTQNELAEKLGVTEQAVSKWENEICCPDISLLPQIARLFQISIDRLFNFHIDSYGADVEKVIAEYSEIDTVAANGQTNADVWRGKIAFLSREIKKYPNSNKLKLLLAWDYHMLNRMAETEEEKTAAAETAVKICRGITADSFDEASLNEAYGILSGVYAENSQPEKALAALEKLTGVDSFAQTVIKKAHIYRESENFDALRKHTQQFLWDCYCVMFYTNFIFGLSLESQNKFEEAITQYQLQHQILTLFDSGGSDINLLHKMQNYLRLAFMFRTMDKKDDCAKCLSRFTECGERLQNIHEHKIAKMNFFFSELDVNEEFMRGKDVEIYLKEMLSLFNGFID